MNRRSFLRGVLSAAVLASANIENIIDNCISQTAHLSDDEFTDYVAFIHFSMNLWVDNPRSCAVITNIGEE